MPRIVLFGATGYTGTLTAEVLVAKGAAPVLAARNRERLDALAQRLGGLETAIADVSDPGSVRALVERGDVLIATVGPFARWGEPAVQAAIAAGANYLDSTGEGSFIREVFERYGPGAEAAGCGLATAFGYDWVPGNLAGGLALRDAGDAATRVDVGYFITGGGGMGGMSGGTRASAAGAMLDPSFAWQGGRLVTERPAKRYRTFPVRGKDQPGVAVGTSEAFALPRAARQLRDVNVYLGWFGPMSRPMQGVGLLGSVVGKVPGARSAIDSVTGRFVKGSTGGPGPEERSKSGSHVVAIAYDAGGSEVARATLEGPNGYDLTAEFLAWGAITARDGGMQGTGALGPVDGFGLDALEAGVAAAGLKRVD